MKQGYSLLSQVFVVVAAVSRCLVAVTSIKRIFSICFYASIIIALAFMGLAVFGNEKKEYANLVRLDTDTRLDIFSLLFSVGLFFDFVITDVELYYIFTDSTRGLGLTATLMIISSIFALVSSLYMMLVSLSYRKDSAYDFRMLGVFNLAPLLWITFKGFVGLADVIEINDINSVTQYIAICLGIFAFYFYTKGVDKRENATSFGVFFFRAFEIVAFVGIISSILSIIKNEASPWDSQCVLSLTLFLGGAFTYLLSEDVQKSNRVG